MKSGFYPATRRMTMEEYAAGCLVPDSPQGSVFLDILYKKGVEVKTGLSIIIMNYMDAVSMDTQRLRECSMMVTVPDGRAIPFCSYHLTNSAGKRVYPPWCKRSCAASEIGRRGVRRRLVRQGPTPCFRLREGAGMLYKKRNEWLITPLPTTRTAACNAVCAWRFALRRAGVQRRGYPYAAHPERCVGCTTCSGNCPKRALLVRPQAMRPTTPSQTRTAPSPSPTSFARSTPVPTFHHAELGASLATGCSEPHRQRRAPARCAHAA